MRSRLSGPIPGPSSSTRISISFSEPPEPHPHRLAGGEKERALSDEIADHLAQAGVVAEHHEGLLAVDRQRRIGDVELGGGLIVLAHLVRDRDDGVTSLVRSTGCASTRASSASSREASEISVISRSSRFTSSLTISMSRSRCSSVLANGKVSTALLQRGQRVLQFVARHPRRRPRSRRCGCRARRSCRGARRRDGRSRRAAR